VPRHDVVDDDTAVHGCHLAQAAELQLAAEHLVDLCADAVEVPVNAGRQLPAENPSGALQWASMHGIDAQDLEHTP
jgi:hypothetical protein